MVRAYLNKEIFQARNQDFISTPALMVLPGHRLRVGKNMIPRRASIFRLPVKPVFLLLLPFLSYTENLSAQTEEYTLKAALLERFTRFIEWPRSTNVADTSAPFVISVLGDNPFESLLEILYEKHDIKNKKVEIRYIKAVHELESTNLLFIAQSHKTQLTDILQHVADQPILTVSDSQGYAKKGVHINFYLVEASVRFEINQQAFLRSKLHASYQLFLKLARIIEMTGEGL